VLKVVLFALGVSRFADLSAWQFFSGGLLWPVLTDCDGSDAPLAVHRSAADTRTYAAQARRVNQERIWRSSAAAAMRQPISRPATISSYPSLGSSRPAPAGVRANTLDPHGHGSDSFKPGKTFDCTASGWAGDAVQSSSSLALGVLVEAFLVSTGVVALGEMGDKTQLLAILLAAKFRRPLPIILGILVATLVNHAFAGAFGDWVAKALGPDILRWVIGVSFIAMAGWMLKPDKVDDEAAGGKQRFGVFGTTVVAFFLAEMGDKTQIATVALAARYNDLVSVVAGTTIGMMLANVPAVFLGERIAKKVPMTLVHGVAAAIFAVLGLLTLFDVGNLL